MNPYARSLHYQHWTWASHPGLYSRKHKTTGMNVHVVCALSGNCSRERPVHDHDGGLAPPATPPSQWSSARSCRVAGMSVCLSHRLLSVSKWPLRGEAIMAAEHTA
jgi:hypothetical protein